MPETMSVLKLSESLAESGNEVGRWPGHLPVYVALEDGELRRITSVQLVGTGNDLCVVLYAGVPKEEGEN